MESNAVYVREKGNLRRVGDIVLENPNPVSSCRRTDPFVHRKEHFIFIYDEEGSLRYTPKSLFNIALRFVADNIHHVDNLIGFPEQIADKLFATVEENGLFLKPDIAPKALGLFCDAYGEMVLGSLCLRNKFPLLHERIEEIKRFDKLKSLDLFGCRLGDSHELFHHLTSSSLGGTLIQLFIGGNGLSDAGLQRLTSPIRMKKKGLDCLQLLDISYNPISERSLRYIACLPKLIQLDVSGTSLELDSGLKTSIWNMLGLIYSEEPLDTFDHATCKTEGWAEQVINQWETNASQMSKQKKVDESRMSALRFFGRQKFVREVLNEKPQASGSADTDKKTKLHFHRPGNQSESPSATKPQVHSPSNNVNKRKRESEGRESSDPESQENVAPPLSKEDDEMLNSYLRIVP